MDVKNERRKVKGERCEATSSTAQYLATCYFVDASSSATCSYMQLHAAIVFCEPSTSTISIFSRHRKPKSTVIHSEWLLAVILPMTSNACMWWHSPTMRCHHHRQSNSPGDDMQWHAMTWSDTIQWLDFPLRKQCHVQHQQHHCIVPEWPLDWHDQDGVVEWCGRRRSI